MRVIYAGGTICNFRTLQRLALIADEIAFLDRPSIMYGNGGTIGRASEVRRFNMNGVPIHIHALGEPPPPAKALFRHYLDADLTNPRFLGTFLEGLRRNATFRNRFIGDEANYGEHAGKGYDVAQGLLNDPDVALRAIGGPIGSQPPFDMRTPEGRAETLRVVAADASFETTNAMLQAQQFGLAPVSDDPYLCRLLGMRGYDERYVRESPKSAPALAIAMAESVIPDAILDDLRMKEIFEYRIRSKDAFDAWTVEIDKLAARLENVDAENADAEIRNIIATDVTPKLIDYRNSMIATRDAMFGGLIKSVALQVPSASIAYLVGASPTQALLTFVASFAPAIPALVDFVAQREDARRKNSMAYLIGVSPE